MGFTLAELVVVLIIVGLLLAGLLTPLATQVNVRRTTETQKTLEEAKEALLGFAAANGRLPCPASAASSGVESFCVSPAGACTPTATYQSHGVCSNSFDGFLPAVTLGLSGTDNQGYVLDGWALSPFNRLRYAVSDTPLDTNSPPSRLTSQDGMRTAGISAIASKSFLYVCSAAPGASPATNCGSANTLTSKAPAVIYSVGANAATGGTGPDESANPNPNASVADPVFVSHTKSAAVGNEFDDIVTWLSINTLMSRMVAAGRLP